MSRTLEEIKQDIRDKGIIKNEHLIHETAIEIYNGERVIDLHKNIQKILKKQLRRKYGQ